MAIHTMVKNNTFNGMRLPSIALRKQDGSISVIRSFGYEDFKERLSSTQGDGDVVRHDKGTEMLS